MSAELANIQQVKNSISNLKSGISSIIDFSKLDEKNFPYYFTTSGTFIVPEDGTYFMIASGGGGSGAACEETSTAFLGGGCSGVLASTEVALTSGTSITVTIGAGGAGVLVSGTGAAVSNGNPGNDTTIGAHLTAAGGAAGSVLGDVFSAGVGASNLAGEAGTLSPGGTAMGVVISNGVGNASPSDIPAMGTEQHDKR